MQQQGDRAGPGGGPPAAGPAPSGTTTGAAAPGSRAGGFEQSGIEREDGVEGVFSYTETKTLVLDAPPTGF